MFLLYKVQEVAHGEDDYYTFSERVPVAVSNNREELELAVQRYNEQHHNNWSKIKAFKEDWETKNPKPAVKQYKKTKKWGVLNNIDITPEMREERKFIRDYNRMVDRENALTFLAWEKELEHAIQGFKNSLPPKETYEIMSIPMFVDNMLS